MARRRSLVLLVWLASLLGPSTAAAQDEQVRVGQRVRLSHGGYWKGVIQQATPDSIRLDLDGGRGPVSFPMADVDRIDVFDGRGSRGTSAVIGIGIGGAAGLVGALLSQEGDCDAESDILGLAAGLCDAINQTLLIYLPLGGVVIGGALGALVGGGDRWRSAHVAPRLGVTAKGRRSFSLGMRLSM